MSGTDAGGCASGLVGSKKRSLEETLLGEAKQKAEALKKKKRDDNSEKGSITTNKKPKAKANRKSLLSFNDEEE